MDESESESEEARSGSALPAPPPGPWGKILGMFALLIVAGLLVFFSFLWLGKRGIDSTKETVVEIAKAFRPEEVVKTFEEWRGLTAKGTEGNILEVSTAESTETFRRTTNLAMFGKTLPLGTTVSEISVPATYRYHIDLDGDWFLTADGERLLVLAPRIEPSLPVAFDTAGVRKKSTSGWARWDADDNLALLEETVTSKLAERAADEKSIDAVRDESRIAVAKFVRTWLLARDAWGERKFKEIVVLFEDEKGRSLSVTPPALRLDEEDADREPPLP